MSTPASFGQAQKLLDSLKGITSEEVQNLVRNIGLIRVMASCDLARVDRAEFEAFLNPPPATTTPIAWRPVSEYADKIAEWNKLRGWGLTKAQIAAFAANLVDHDHLDPLHPTGISLWLGHDLPYNCEEVMACLRHEVEALGEKFKQPINSSRVSFLSGSEQTGGSNLTVALLDLATYWTPIDGVVPNEIRKIEKRLPGLEVAWLLALNPQVYLAIDYYETIPGLIAAGLVVDSDLVPCFGSSLDETFVESYWAGWHWHGCSVVAFRE